MFSYVQNILTVLREIHTTLRSIQGDLRNLINMLEARK